MRDNTDLPETVRDAIEQFGSNRWQNFLYNPVVIVAYKLDPRYCGNRLNARLCKDGHPVLGLLVFSVFRYKRPDQKD